MSKEEAISPPSAAMVPAARLCLHTENMEARRQLLELTERATGTSAQEGDHPRAGGGEPRRDEKGEEDGEQSHCWSQLACKLGTGCRPFLEREDAAAAAAAALLQRLGGGGANGCGALPAAAPLARHVPQPLMCRPLPLFCRSRRVKFNEDLNTEHEVTPYAEVYGRHPREFVFDRDFQMVEAAPGGFVSLNATAPGDDEDDEEDEEDPALEANDTEGEPACPTKSMQTPAWKNEEKWPVPQRPQAEARLVDIEKQDYQEEEECHFVLPAELEEELEVGPDSLVFAGSREYKQAASDEGWEAFLAAAWSAYDLDVHTAKQDAPGCAAYAAWGEPRRAVDGMNLTSAFTFSPLLMTAW